MDSPVLNHAWKFQRSIYEPWCRFNPGFQHDGSFLPLQRKAFSWGAGHVPSSRSFRCISPHPLPLITAIALPGNGTARDLTGSNLCSRLGAAPGPPPLPPTPWPGDTPRRAAAPRTVPPAVRGRSSSMRERPKRNHRPSGRRQRPTGLRETKPPLPTPAGPGASRGCPFASHPPLITLL